MKIFLLVCCIVMIGFGVSLGATIESITVYEKTGYVKPFTYLVNDPHLGQDPLFGSESFDFTFFPGGTEVYDIYLSDKDRTPNMQGMYLTIDCSFPGNGIANNIDAVSLNYDDGTQKWATVVANYILGRYIWEKQTYDNAYLWAALGLPDDIPTFVGDEFSSITVGFGLTQPINPVPEPGILFLLGLSMVSIAGLKRWWK